MQAGYQIVVTALDPESVPLSAIDWSKPTAFVLGNEVGPSARPAWTL